MIDYRPDPAALAAEVLKRAAGPKALAEHADPIEWIKANYFLYDTGKLMTFEPCQEIPLREALATDSEGRFKYATVLWSWPKKSAKSSVIAAVALWTACTKPKSSIKLIANDLRQADTRVGFYIREAIKLNPALKLTTKINISGYRITFANGSIIESLPIDPTGEAGGNDDLLIFSELHGWKTTAQQKMFAESTLSPTKYGKSQRWIDTYAGYSGESPILENLYRLSVLEGTKKWDEWEVFTNESAKILATWVTQPMLPWQLGENGKAYYQEEAAHLTPMEFDRLHRNQWVSSSQTFVPAAWWHACKQPLHEWDSFLECVVGIDAAVSGDSFGIVCLSRHGFEYSVRDSQEWIPPKGGSLVYENPEDEEDPLYPAGYLKALADRYNVVAFMYDPYQMHHLSTQFLRSGVGFFTPMNQGRPRLVADKALYDAIRERRIHHEGDEALTRHVLNANSTADAKDTLRIIKRSEHLKIDLCVALSIALCAAMRYLPE